MKKALILAAGMGIRIGTAEQQIPKCLLKVAGKSLLERMVHSLLNQNVTSITIVVGYLKEMIIVEVTRLFPRKSIRFVNNDDFQKGNLLSVWEARDVINEGFLLMDADVLFHEKILNRLITSYHKNCFLLDQEFETGDEPVKVVVQNNRVIDFDRRVQKDCDFLGESVGFFKFSDKGAETFKQYLSRYIQNGDLDADYDFALRDMLGEEPFGYEDITGLPWIEIDFPEDMETARNIIHAETSNLHKFLSTNQTTIIEEKPWILLNPGPGNTTETVRQALLTPDLCHREKEFFLVMQEVRRKLVMLADGETSHSAVIFTGSGTSAVEATICSVVPRDGKLLVIDNGVYGDRMCRIAEAHSLNFSRLTYEWTEVPAIQDIADALAKDVQITHLAVIHHETTTGLLNPIKEIGALTAQHNVSLIVDGMSSFIAEPISVEKDNIEFLISSSNKAVQGIAGLAFVIARKSELHKLKEYQPRSVYLDVYNQWLLQEEDNTPFTPAIQVFFALNQALDELIEEGLAARHTRYLENALTLRKGMEEMGFNIMIPEKHRSSCLTTFFMPPGFSYEIFHDKMKAKGFIIYAGQGSLKKNAFRIANVGDLIKNDILDFMKSCKEVLIDMKSFPVRYS